MLNLQYKSFYVPVDIYQIPKNPQDRWSWVLFRLRLKGASCTSLAAELGVTRSCVTNVKRTRYPRIQRAIAQRIGFRPEEIWPDRYADSITAARRGNGRKRDLFKHEAA